MPPEVALGRQVVRGVEVDGVDLVEVDEVGDLDVPRTVRLRRRQLFVAQDDVLAAAEVHALDDVGCLDLLAGPLIHLLVADAVRCVRSRTG